jgi:hypothetical protein
MGISTVNYLPPQEAALFATVAAVLFAIAFILDLIGRSYNNLVNAGTLIALGLVFLALHLAPLADYRTRYRRRR